MAQILRPDAQISRSNVIGDSSETTDLHNKINDESDLTYVQISSGNPSGTLMVGFPTPITPDSGISTVYFRHKLAPLSTCRVRLYAGTTLLDSLSIDGSANAWVEENFEVTVNDYSDLRVEIYVTRVTIYSAANCSEVWVEVPDAVSGIGLEMGCNF